MNKILRIFTAVVAFLTGVSATAQPSKADNSLLWRISGKGLAKPSYLFGTIHLVCRNDYFWTDAMKQSFDKSDKLCLEMDMDDMNVMMAASAGLMDRSGKKLSSYFTPEQYKLLGTYAKDSLGLDISMLEMMKPVALQTLMATRSVASCDDAVSYEDSIMKSAQASNKEIMGLESPEDQLKALESIPTDSVIKGVMDVVEHKETGEDHEYEEMMAAYKAQDITKLHTIIMQSDEFGNATTTLVDDRNKKWIKIMPGMMNKSSIFFAVGAGHLWGQNGVISLLKKDGYKVEPVK